MPPQKPASRKGTVTNYLDSRVLNHIIQIQEAQPDSFMNLGISQLYDLIKERDMQMRRVKKPHLQSSIERALKILQPVDPGENESLDSSFEGLDDLNLVEVKDTNELNNLITSNWSSNQTPNISRGQTPTAQMTDGLPPVQKSTLQDMGKRKATKVRTEDLKRQKKSMFLSIYANIHDWQPPTTTSLADLGGIDDCIKEVVELIVMPLKHPEIYAYTGVQPPRGVLLYGPPGCGKTLLANALAGELGLPFISVSAPALVSGMSGESEKKVREIFEEAKRNAPCLMFIDEIDAITQKRETAQREMERRIVAQLLTCMDDLSLEKTEGKPVLIMGATNRPDSLDPALRRAGRFDREICMNVPDDQARESILRILCKRLRLSGDFNFKALAKMTPGFVGADLQALVTAAGIIAVKRMIEKVREIALPSLDKMDMDHVIEPPYEESSGPVSVLHAFIKEDPGPLTPEQMKDLAIQESDFIAAIPKVQPSAKREGFATVPDVTWDNVGAMSKLREQLQLAIVQQIKEPEAYSAVGITAASGVLLWGPPGCGKTLLAKAVANESKANFISVKGPELLNKYVGESERAVRQVFQRARASAPCIIFFDELDALVPKRDDAMSEASSRVVNTLLTELDGLNDRKGVYVIGATNRPDIIDPAMIRPGRLDHPLFVALPAPSERTEILSTLTRNTPLAEDVDLKAIAEDPRAKNLSGADISALVRQASILSLKRTLLMQDSNEAKKCWRDIKVAMEHFEQALDTMRPSVSDQEKRKYEQLRTVFDIVR